VVRYVGYKMDGALKTGAQEPGRCRINIDTESQEKNLRKRISGKNRKISGK
jgi:hypothetical protein